MTNFFGLKTTIRTKSWETRGAKRSCAFGFIAYLVVGSDEGSAIIPTCATMQTVHLHTAVVIGKVTVIEGLWSIVCLNASTPRCT